MTLTKYSKVYWYDHKPTDDNNGLVMVFLVMMMWRTFILNGLKPKKKEI